MKCKQYFLMAMLMVSSYQSILPISWRDVGKGVYALLDGMANPPGSAFYGHKSARIQIKKETPEEKIAKAAQIGQESVDYFKKRIEGSSEQEKPALRVLFSYADRLNKEVQQLTSQEAPKANAIVNQLGAMILVDNLNYPDKYAVAQRIAQWDQDEKKNEENKNVIGKMSDFCQSELSKLSNVASEDAQKYQACVNILKPYIK